MTRPTSQPRSYDEIASELPVCPHCECVVHGNVQTFGGDVFHSHCFESVADEMFPQEVEPLHFTQQELEDMHQAELDYIHHVDENALI